MNWISNEQNSNMKHTSRLLGKKLLSRTLFARSAYFMLAININKQVSHQKYIVKDMWNKYNMHTNENVMLTQKSLLQKYITLIVRISRCYIFDSKSVTLITARTSVHNKQTVTSTTAEISQMQNTHTHTQYTDTRQSGSYKKTLKMTKAINRKTRTIEKVSPTLLDASGHCMRSECWVV